MSVVEIETDVVGSCVFLGVNSLMSNDNNLSHNQLKPSTYMHRAFTNSDNDDYCVSYSFIEKSLKDDDADSNLSDWDKEATSIDSSHMVQLLSIAESEKCTFFFKNEVMLK